ncbi:MAG: biopolymer transporter ExbD [Prevotella sp.]|nr:biopolymer transporter ExbD [Prevotella sp.]
MIIKRKITHGVPALDTTSTADISFMLLIFFLVTTSMDIDKGLTRQLPPVDKAEQEQTVDVKKENLMPFRIDADSKLLLDEVVVPTKKLRKKIQQFVESRGSNHLITIDANPKASYDVYFHLQNEIVAAYNAVRNQVAKKKYGKTFAQLTDEQKDVVRQLCPQRIAEQYNTLKEEQQ